MQDEQDLAEVERARKGGALSTITLLLINAEDHNITKIIGIVFKI